MNSHTNTAKPPEELWDIPWPEEDLEYVGCCPVCGDTSRNLLHSDVVDNAFHAAPGKWALWVCVTCGSAYLDPRPTPVTIQRAYANYYTHQEVTTKADYTSLCPFRKLRRRLVNGYTNWRYGTQALPFSLIGILVVYAMPGVRMALDREYRHLPKRPNGGGDLLDVGCGDGSFLCLARTCGWNVVGLDPDPSAAANASKRGLAVHTGGIEYFDGQAELFDVITLSHVIEHVYQPFEVLKRCHDLLKPGGQLWLETPNIDSYGHALFKKNWRGLEAPRHLVLFNPISLRKAIYRAGFSTMHDQPRPSPCPYMFNESYAMSRGLTANTKIVAPAKIRVYGFISAVAEKVITSRRELLTVTTIKVRK